MRDRILYKQQLAEYLNSNNYEYITELQMHVLFQKLGHDLIIKEQNESYLQNDKENRNEN